jgi:succinylarginine dihydrolase
MRQLLALGVPQAVLPPLPRPDLAFLRQAGFTGDDTTVLEQAARRDPYLLRLAMSSAFMWAANAATVIPSCDSTDQRCHLITANLIATPHRALEAPARAAMLRVLFPDPDRVVVHDPLPASLALSDEGAANHSRLCAPHQGKGYHLFVYGRAAAVPPHVLPSRFPARQSREASHAVARLGHLPCTQALFVRQQAAAIDAGAFHNDVVMVGDGNRMLVHELCFDEQAAVLKTLSQQVPSLQVHQVSQQDLPLNQAISSYLFNSQLLRTPQGYVLLAPNESRSGAAFRVTQHLLDSGFVDQVYFQELGQSMAGGGGPACLRLRLLLNQDEIASMAPGVILNDTTIQELEAWVERHYRDQLEPAELADPQLLHETRQALDTLTQLLNLGSLYPFQRDTL